MKLATLLLLAASAIAAPWDGTKNGITIITFQVKNYPPPADPGTVPFVTELLIKSDDPQVTSFRVDISLIRPDGTPDHSYQVADVDIAVAAKLRRHVR